MYIAEHGAWTLVSTVAQSVCLMDANEIWVWWVGGLQNHHDPLICDCMVQYGNNLGYKHYVESPYSDFRHDKWNFFIQKMKMRKLDRCFI